MPTLLNLRHERFAQLRAKGYSLEEAYELAGFVRDSGHACRLARRPKVAGRIAELRLEIGQAAPRANLEQTIAGLLSLVERADYQTTPAHLAEARLTLMEAHRLHEIWMERRAEEREKLALARRIGRRSEPLALPAPGQNPALSAPAERDRFARENFGLSVG